MRSFYRFPNFVLFISNTMKAKRPSTLAPPSPSAFLTHIWRFLAVSLGSCVILLLEVFAKNSIQRDYVASLLSSSP